MIKKAYAKVNLVLKVISKENNGYHLLSTVMEKVDLFDEVEFLEAKEIVVKCNNVAIEQEDNLIYKAILELKKAYPEETKGKGIEIRVTKHIPIGAGLGGGSSDAALTISTLNELWELKKEKKDLACITKKIGSDVSFFLEDKRCVVEGIGEVVKPFDSDMIFHYLLYYPGYSTLTKDVYEANKVYSTDNYINCLKKALENNDFVKVLNYMSNDLQDAAFDINKDEPKLKDMIELFNYTILKTDVIGKAILTGSGSCIFMAFRSEEDSLKVQKELLKKKIYTANIKTILK